MPRISAPAANDEAAMPLALGSHRSTYAPPAFAYAIVAPLLLSAVVVGFARLIAQASTHLALLLGAMSLGLLVWTPVRTRGVSVALHTQGLVLSRGGSSATILFDEVDELWFELQWLQVQGNALAKGGAYLRAMRLVDFAGHVHRVPLEVVDGTALALGILRGVQPTLIDARRALAEGQTLTFGNVQIDRGSLIVNGARAAWNELRLVRVAPARIFFFRQHSLFAWQKVRLGRVPNPHILVDLAVACAPHADRDGVIFGSDLDRLSPADRAAAAGPLLAQGAFLLLVGVLVTWLTSSMSLHVIAWGAIVGGALRLILGIMCALRSN